MGPDHDKRPYCKCCQGHVEVVERDGDTICTECATVLDTCNVDVYHDIRIFHDNQHMQRIEMPNHHYQSIVAHHSDRGEIGITGQGREGSRLAHLNRAVTGKAKPSNGGGVSDKEADTARNIMQAIVEKLPGVPEDLLVIWALEALGKYVAETGEQPFKKGKNSLHGLLAACLFLTARNGLNVHISIDHWAAAANVAPKYVWEGTKNIKPFFIATAPSSASAPAPAATSSSASTSGFGSRISEEDSARVESQRLRGHVMQLSRLLANEMDFRTRACALSMAEGLVECPNLPCKPQFVAAVLLHVAGLLYERPLDMQSLAKEAKMNMRSLRKAYNHLFPLFKQIVPDGRFGEHYLDWVGKLRPP